MAALVSSALLFQCPLLSPTGLFSPPEAVAANLGVESEAGIRPSPVSAASVSTAAGTKISAGGSLALAAVRSVVLIAADGVSVHADFYPGSGRAQRSLILLFHQAGSNAAEYETIALRLAGLGFNCLAVDQRSGGYRWGRNNRTVAGLGRPVDFLSAYADLEAALEWAQRGRMAGGELVGSDGEEPRSAAAEQAGLSRAATPGEVTKHDESSGWVAAGKHGEAPGRGKVIVWGSSYSASLVLRLAAEHEGIAAVLAFSPGMRMGVEYSVRDWARKVKTPTFITSGPGSEAATARFLFEAIPAAGKVVYLPREGVHGSSTLRCDRNPAGCEDNWDAVTEFLKPFL